MLISKSLKQSCQTEKSLNFFKVIDMYFLFMNNSWIESSQDKKTVEKRFHLLVQEECEKEMQNV